MRAAKYLKGHPNIWDHEIANTPLFVDDAGAPQELKGKTVKEILAYYIEEGWWDNSEEEEMIESLRA